MEDMDFYDSVEDMGGVVSPPVFDGADQSEEFNTGTVSDEVSNSDPESKLVDRNDTLVDEDSMAATYTVPSDIFGDMEVSDDDDPDESDVYSPEERLAMLADMILSCCVGGKAIQQIALDKLLLLPSPTIFRDENYVLFLVLYNYRGKIRQLNIDEEFIRLYLKRNQKILLNAGNLIDINAYGEVDGSSALGYIGGVLKHYKRLCSMEDFSEVEFETAFEKYLIEYKALEAERVYQQASVILTDGMTIGKKKYFGFEDSQNYAKRRLAEIEGMINIQSGSGFVSMREMLTDEKEKKKSYKISDFDRLTALNDIYGGIYTGMFYQVVAPPKSGKSKFMARLVHTTAVKFGNNVTVWAAEGGKEAFLAQLRAIHFDYIYNTGADITEKKFGVSQDAILHDKFPSDELKQLENSSKLDLATNQDYGNVDFIDRPFSYENYLEDLNTSVKSNNSVMAVVDYLQYMSAPKGMSEREAIASAYKESLAYCNTNNIAFITPGQYKQDSVDKLLEMKDTSKADMRTAGGSSAEVERTPDIIFAFWATTQDIANNRLKILSMPCRYNKPFPEIDVAIDYESCQFISLNE